MAELYVTYRKVWIEQREDGNYNTEKRFPLHDDRITDHLLQKKTVGLTVDKVTKFITFDIDYGKDNMKLADKAVHKLIDSLEEHDIGLENILVSFSGSKGYHLEIFFDRPISVKIAKSWHNKVVQSIGATTDKIEFRPSHQGIKLPLGIHKVTGKRCYIVHPITLEEMSDEHILNIVQLNGDNFQDDAISWLKEKVETPTVILEKKKAEEFVEVLDMTKLDITVDYEERCMTMLSENQLTYPDSRHQSTRLLLTFLANNGYSEADSVDLVQKVIKNTFKVARHLIDKDTTEEKALSEVARLWKYQYDKTFGQHNTIIQVYENEILEVLEPKQMHLKQLLFILLVHSKKHANKDGVFYMTYKQMADMGADNNGARLLKHIKQLEEIGLMEVVERNRKNGLKHLPNKYKVNVSPTTERYIELDTTLTHDVKLEKVVAHLVTEDKLKEMVTQDQFYKKFKPEYKALAV